MDALIVIGIIAVGIFIYSKFKKFERIKHQIISKLIGYGFEGRRAIVIYDTNHYEISKMISAGYTVNEIAHRYAEKYSK